MVFTRLAGQSNISSDFGGGGPNGALAIGFTPSATIAINAVRMNRSAAMTQPAQVGIASAIGATPNNVTWISKTDSADFNRAGWSTAIIPATTLISGTPYFLVFACPAGGDAYAFMGPGGSAGTYTGISTANIRQATPMTNGWVGPYTTFVQGFDLGTDTPPGPTLAAVPNPATGAVELTVTNATGAISVKRYVQGVSPTGTLVRGSFANGRMVPDYDAPLNTDLVYIATDTVGQSPQSAARLDTSEAILTVMSNPTLSARVEVLADEDQRWEGRSTVHKILGTNTPLVTVEAPAYRSGRYRLLLPGYDDWQALRSIQMTGAVLLLRSPCQTEYPDTPFVWTGWANTQPWNAQPPRHRIAEIDYQATAPDADPPVEYAWTYADLAAGYATYDELPVEFGTYAEMATHVPEPPP
jgi:hypothetical protein